MAPQPQVFSNAAKATALANAEAALPGSWALTENWSGFGFGVASQGTGSGEVTAAAGAAPGERYILPFYAGKIDLILLANGNWQATLFPGS